MSWFKALTDVGGFCLFQVGSSYVINFIFDLPNLPKVHEFVDLPYIDHIITNSICIYDTRSILLSALNLPISKCVFASLDSTVLRLFSMVLWVQFLDTLFSEESLKFYESNRCSCFDWFVIYHIFLD